MNQFTETPFWIKHKRCETCWNWTHRPEHKPSQLWGSCKVWRRASIYAEFTKNSYSCEKWGKGA